MPLTFESPSLAGSSPDAIDRVIQRNQGLLTHGDPLARLDEEKPPAATWGETWRAQVGMTWMQGAVDLAFRDKDETPDLHSGFSSFRYIRENPRLASDPNVLALVERGQFDASLSEDEFWADYTLGMRFLEDARTLDRSTTTRRLVAGAGTILGDPINLLPLGLGATAVRSGTALARAAKFVAITGSAAVAEEKLTNFLQPASDTPGLQNELAAFTAGAGLGGTIGFLTAPGVRGAFGGLVPTRKLQQLRREVDRLSVSREVSQIDYDSELFRAPSTTATVGEVRPLTTAKTQLGEEVGRGVEYLRRVLDEDPIDHRVVVALNREGDEAAGVLGNLKAKYEAAGKSLHVVEHPDQRWYDMLSEARTILDDPAMNVAATSAELGGGWIDQAASSITSRYADSVSFVTPGGRVASTVLGRIQDTYRTLSGSAQTITRGSALNPFGYKTGAAAENLKSVLEGLKDTAVLKVRDAYRSARRSGAQSVRYNGRDIPLNSFGGYAEFRVAITDYMRREAAKQAGFLDALPTDVDPAITRAAGAVRDYFERLGSDAADVRLLSTFEKGRAYTPRVYDVSKVLAGEADFKARLIDSFTRRLGTVDGVSVMPHERRLVDDVVERLPADRIAAIRDVKPKPQTEPTLFAPGEVAPEPKPVRLVEGDLPPDLLALYRAELDGYFRRNAQSVFDKITSPRERHGVSDALPSAEPLKARTLDVDESSIADYLEGDVEALLERYHNVMSGRVAVRRAIQLNPTVWADARLADGAPVVDGPGIMQYLRESMDALDAVARQADLDARAPAAGRESLAGAVRRLRHRIESDIGVPLDLIEGRHPFGHDGGVLAAARYFGRQALRLSYLNKLGSMAIAQLSDVGSLAVKAMQTPGSVKRLADAVLHLKSLPKRDLEIAGLFFDNVARERSFADLDQLVAGRGFGEGVVRQATAGVERAGERAVDVFSRATMQNWTTDLMKRWGGMMELDRITNHARRMVLAKRLIAAGSDEADALRRVGLSKLDAASLNKIGLDADRANLYLEQVYKHGLDANDRPIRDQVATFDDFLGPDKSKSAPFMSSGLKPNYEAWDMSEPAVKDLLDTVLANVNGTVSRSLVPTPGVFDKPLINQAVMGKVFNQFQSFNLAFGNQRLRVIAQLPLKYQLPYYMSYVFLGAMADAISNHLSGRRSFDDTAKLWRENPTGATYAAWERSGVSAWLGRPMAIGDALGVPFAPGNLTGNTTGSTSARHVLPGSALTFFGPVAADVDRAARLLGRVSRGELDDRAGYEAWKLAPFQNLIWLRLLHRTTGAPVVPEALRENERELGK